MKAVLERFRYQEEQTLGVLKLSNESGLIFECKTLELADDGNLPNISCIPEGNYRVNPRKSAKFKNHFIVEDVPNREYILIHKGNFYTDIRGCILVGKEHIDINGDGLLDVTSSADTVKMLLFLASDGFDLEIINNSK